MFSFGSKKVVALDIGTSTIKMAEVEISRGGATLNAFAMMPTPPQSIAGGDILDATSLAQTVATLVQELKTQRRSVSAGLWGSSVIIKKITLPRMDEKVVEEQIRWEAEQYIPFDINEVNLAFRVLRGIKNSPETMDILIIAARQEQVGKYAEVAELAGLNCQILDVGGFALANCFEANYGVAAGQAIILLNVGASVTNFVIIDNGEVVFCRDIPAGGLTYTTEIQKALSVSLEEAESIKISACSGQEAPQEVPGIIQATHEIYGDEVQGSVDFFANTNANVALQKCFITGGGSRVPGLTENLSRVLKIPVELMDPFIKVKYRSNSLSPSFVADIRDFATISLGLGMRQSGDA